jgi:hypothetical protein
VKNPISVAILAASLVLDAGEADAAGCLKGAAVGAVAGHYYHHHAILGAIAGCAIGHHMAAKAQQKATAASKPAPSH